MRIDIKIGRGPELYPPPRLLLKLKLELRSCLVTLVSLPDLAKRFELGVERVKEFCDESHLPVTSVGTTEYMAIYKPSVVEHPETGEPALLVSLSSSLSAVHRAFMSTFRRDYSGLPWMPHRLVWGTNWLESIVGRLHYRRARQIFSATGNILVNGTSAPLAGANTLMSLFTEQDWAALAAASRKYYSSFLWQAGDVLVIDNLKLAHNGMPGRGRRQLNVMMLNPVRFRTTATSPGIQGPEDMFVPPSDFEVQLRQLRQPLSAAAA